MKSIISAAVLGLFAVAASGVAIPNEARSDDVNAAGNIAVEPIVIAKRAITHLFVCTDNNFGGRCQNLESVTGQCYNLQNGFNDVVSSLGPDSGTTCTLYDDYGCNGGSLPGIVAPGIYVLNDYGWNDRASAYRCN